MKTTDSVTTPSQKVTRKTRYYRIAWEGSENWCYVSEKELGDTVLSFVDGLSVGYGIKVEPTDMTDEEYEKLPEYEE